MKKLMTILGLALSTASAFADAQLYEMQLTVKTTLTKSGSVKMVACDCRTDESGLYRTQGTMKIKGVIWGCDCGTLLKGEPYVSPTNVYGYIFWNETTKQPLGVKLEWPIGNRITASAKKAEVVWKLYSEDGTFFLVGSGFGTIKDTVSKDPCYLVTSWFPSLSGSFAGWVMPDAVVTSAGTPEECGWCKKIPATPSVSEIAKGWGICAECSPNTTNLASAAFGTWKIKYNAKISKKLENAGEKQIEKITDAYPFPSYVKSVME